MKTTYLLVFTTKQMLMTRVTLLSCLNFIGKAL